MLYPDARVGGDRAVASLPHMQAAVIHHVPRLPQFLGNLGVGGGLKTHAPGVPADFLRDPSGLLDALVAHALELEEQCGPVRRELVSRPECTPGIIVPTVVRLDAAGIEELHLAHGVRPLGENPPGRVHGIVHAFEGHDPPRDAPANGLHPDRHLRDNPKRSLRAHEHTP